LSTNLRLCLPSGLFFLLAFPPISYMPSFSLIVFFLLLWKLNSVPTKIKTCPKREFLCFFHIIYVLFLRAMKVSKSPYFSCKMYLVLLCLQ
jgi:apolipoprotein N-acyltransferase